MHTAPLLLPLLALVAAMFPAPVAAEWGPGVWLQKAGIPLFAKPVVQNVTLFRALASPVPDAAHPGLCTVSGEIIARASHRSSVAEKAVNLLFKDVIANIKASDQVQHWNFVKEFFFAHGNPHSDLDFYAQVGSANIHIPGVQTGEHGITHTPFSLPFVPCDASEVPLTVKQADGHGFEKSVVRIVGETGYTIISDIDDTMKVTEVLNKGKAIENTLLNPFRPTVNHVPFYEMLNSKLASPTTGSPFFAYVSGSPHILYTPLREFLADKGFPAGEVYLSVFGVVDMDLWKGPQTQAHKFTSIRSIMKAYPKRSYVLIGDSGELDAETYGIMYREFPDVDIKCIYIRKVHGGNPTLELVKNSDERFKAAWAGIPEGKAVAFDDPEELFGADIPSGKCF
ncbi:hypothetical protein BC828DRAFT_392070 [Blastocladiella britannica]|nr:hypothetical protein BC828DRAFT_392070 [Blastocladiella britannica]